MLTIRNATIAALLCTAIALGLVLAACGGDDDNGNGDNGNGGEPTVAGTEAPPEATETEATPEVAGAETTLDVTLSDFMVELSLSSVAPGSVTFNLANGATQVHNFKVIATDLLPEELPVDEDVFKADESQLDIVGEAPDVAGGGTDVLTVELEAGSYVLICNIASHYTSGMSAAFTVE